VQDFLLQMPFLSPDQRCYITARNPFCIYRHVSLSILKAIFPGEPRLAGFTLLKLRMMEVVVTTGAISRAKLQSNCHCQQTNTQLFTGRIPFLSPNQQCQSIEGKYLL